MLEIRLNRLNIENFKGIKEFHLDANGNDISILGDNATNKTTCYDAFSWVFSGKNSFNQADFQIKPLDESGNEIHFLDTMVEAEFFVDGKPLKLKKILTENWVKPHGKTEQEYKGNNIAYFFDEVPVGANVYQKKIDELIGSEVFRLLTNPLHFNLHYKLPKLTDWQSRRNLLFEMNGEITDDQIVANNPGLAKLPEVLAGKSIDDRKAIIAQSIKKLNEQIEKIGPAINENMRLVPQTPVDYTATEAELKRLRTKLDATEKELANAGKVIIEFGRKQQQLIGFKNQLESVKSRIYKEANAERQKLVDEKSRLQGEKYQQEANKGDYARQIPIAENGIKERNNGLDQLRKEWGIIKAAYNEAFSSIFVEPDDDNFICPTCGQDLPKKDKEARLEEMRANFEKNKLNMLAHHKKGLEQNSEAGNAVVEEVKGLKKNIEDYRKQVEMAEKSLSDINSRIAEIDGILAKPDIEPDYTSNSEYTELSGKIGQLQAELNRPIEDITAATRQLKANLATRIEDCNHTLNNKQVVENAKARIEELKQSERDLSNQKSQLEGQLNLITEFIKAKANTLTDVMNAKFKHVRFRLFDIQQNGGVVEVCDTMVNTNGKWVPFSDGNTAGRINAGIDIINALSEHYGIRVPVWVDNRESITDIAETDSQVISLIKPDIRTAEDRKKYSKLIVEAA